MNDKPITYHNFRAGSNEYIKIEFSSDIEIHEEYVQSDATGFVSPIPKTDVEDWRITRTIEVPGRPNTSVIMKFEGEESIRDIQYDVNENGFVKWVGSGVRFDKGGFTIGPGDETE